MLRVNHYFVAILLVMALVFPTAFPFVKSVFLAGAIFTAAWVLLAGPVQINRPLLLVALCFPIVGLAYSFYGELLGNPGASRVLTVMVVYPILFPILAAVYEERDASKLFRVFLIAAWLLVLVDVAFILASLTMPSSFYVDFISSLYLEDAVIDDADDYFKFTIPNVSSLMFLLPFFVSAFIVGFGTHKRWHMGALILVMVTLGVLSGRRALFLAAFVGPMLGFILFRSASGVRVARPRNMILVTVAVVMAAGWFVSSDLSDHYLQQIYSIFDFSGNDSNRERVMQFNSLANGFADSPLFGAGAGAAGGYSRSDIQPWAYELSYLAFLYQYGIVGFMLYAAGILLLAWGLSRAIKAKGRASFEFFFFCGFASFLFANATNPYLAKFDYMWVIFIPFAILLSSFRYR